VFEFVSTHIIEFALAQSDGRVGFIVLTAIVDNACLKNYQTHTYTHYCDMHEDFVFYFEISEYKNYNFFSNMTPCS
jgi:predicted CDP-diglyceride synthetase/phosphatidate cytidylyltransferase